MSRPVNLLIIGLTFYLFRLVIVEVKWRDYLDGFILNEWKFLCMVASILFLSAAGNVFNDSLDVTSDRLNSPGRNPVGIDISGQHARMSFIGLTLVGILSGYLSAPRIEFLVFHFAIIILLFFYNKWLKGQPLIGNVVVSALVGSIPLIGLSFIGESVRSVDLSFSYFANHLVGRESGTMEAVRLVYAFSLFAFLMNMAREIVKDIEDMTGDRAQGHKTWPLVSSEKTARLTVILFCILTFVAYFVFFVYPEFFYYKNDLIGLSLLLVLATPILLTVLLLSGHWKRKEPIRLASTLLKISMVIGLLSVLTLYLS